MMTISSGIIVWRKNNNNIEFFMGTPGGPLWGGKECWNFPKGQMENGETAFECALREFHEETGTKLIEERTCYDYYGLIKQRSNKRVHVFIKEWAGEKLDEECFSNIFVWTDGKEYPEIGAYKWMTLDEIKKRGGVKIYYPIFEEIINLNI